MSVNEHTFYRSFTRKEAPQQTSKAFQQTKRQALDLFMKAKYGGGAGSNTL
jgi:hypothetical protein